MVTEESCNAFPHLPSPDRERDFPEIKMLSLSEREKSEL
jgi:hypothetical protein